MKKILIYLVTLTFIALLIGCTAINKTSGGSIPSTLRLMTGDKAGTYYSFGSVIASEVTANTDIDVTCIVGEGSQSNIEALRDGNTEFALAQADVMTYAREGKNSFEESVDNFSVVAALYTEKVQIITLDENIKTVSDLKDKKVSIGAAGSGVYFNAIDILAAYDMTEADIEPSYKSFSQSVEALKSGMIDAAFLVAGTPTAAVSDLIEDWENVYLISIDESHMNRLLEMSSYYTEETILKDTYNTSGDINTLGVKAVILARNEVSEDAVYSVCKCIFENASFLGETHEKYDDLSLEFATSIKAVEYHAGALKYFKEKGYTP